MSAALYILAWLGILLDLLGGLRWAGAVAGMALLGFLLAEFPRQHRYAQIVFLALAGIGAIGIAQAASPMELFLEAWRRGAQFAAFFLSLGMLRDAAETSPLVRRCGAHLVAQPPGRRYAALTGGAHVFGIILSYGAIDLLAAMVMRANATGPGTAARAKRMLLAIYRGFVTMNCWAPLNLMSVVISTAVPAAPMTALMPLGLGFAVVAMAVGWLEDRVVYRHAVAGAAETTRESWAVHLGIVALVLAVMLAAEAVAWGFGVRLATGITLTLPAIGLGWIAVQFARFGPARLAGLLRRRLARFYHRIPAFRGEATILGASGFAGVALGGLFPAAGLAPWLHGLPPLLIPLLVPVVLIGSGQIGLNPIAVVTVLGAVLPAPEALGVASATFAFACMLSWGLAVGMTPMSASALTTARWGRVSPWLVSTVWNGRYTGLNLLVCWLAIALMHAVWPL